MPVVPASDAVVHHLHGSTFSSYVAPATGSTQLCAWRLDVAPHTEGVTHRVAKEEIFYLLTGSLDVTIDGQTGPAAPGDAVFLPAGALVGVTNGTGEPATAWVTTTVGFSAELADGTTISPPWVS